MRATKTYTSPKVRVTSLSLVILGSGCFFVGVMAPAGDHRFRILAAAGFGLIVAGLALKFTFTGRV